MNFGPDFWTVWVNEMLRLLAWPFSGELIPNLVLSFVIIPFLVMLASAIGAKYGADENEWLED